MNITSNLAQMREPVEMHMSALPRSGFVGASQAATPK